MDGQVIAVVEACTRDSDADAARFPEIVARLAAAGVEQYHADLLRAEKTYYMPDGSSHVSACEPIGGAFAESFSAEGVEAAVRAVQQGRLTYADFCGRIAAAGCTSYIVSLTGRRAVYSGRTGDSHTEWFPGAR